MGRHVLPLLVFVVVLAASLGIGRAVPGGDSVPHRYLPLSLLCEGDLDLDEFPFTRHPSGRSLPTPYYLVEGRDGHLYSTFGPAPGVVATPVYAVARALDPVFTYSRVLELAHLSSALLTAAAAALLWLALQPLAGATGATVLALAYGLATPAWSSMSQSLWQHTAAAPFIALGLAALVRWPRRTGLALGALGVAALCRPSNALLVAGALGFVALHRRERLLAALLGLLPAVLFQAAYGLHAFGDPLATGQLAVAADIARAKTGGTSVWILDPGPALAGIVGQFLSPSRGLFVFSPVLALGLLGLVRALRRDGSPLLRWLLLTVLAVVVVHGLRFDWWGGWSFGNRQLLDVVPLLILGLAALWPRLSRTGPLRGLFVGTLLASVFIQWVGATRYDLISWNNAPNVDAHPERLWSLSDSQLIHYLSDLRPRRIPPGSEFPPWTLETCPVEATVIEHRD